MHEVAKIASGPVSAIAGMKPVIGFLAFSTNTMLKLLHMKVEAEEEQVTEDEIRMMIDLGKENGYRRRRRSGSRMYLSLTTHRFRKQYFNGTLRWSHFKLIRKKRSLKNP